MPLRVVGIIDKKAKAQRDSQRHSHPTVRLQSLSTQNPTGLAGCEVECSLSLCGPGASSIEVPWSTYCVCSAQGPTQTCRIPISRDWAWELVWATDFPGEPPGPWSLWKLGLGHWIN